MSPPITRSPSLSRIKSRRLPLPRSGSESSTLNRARSEDAAHRQQIYVLSADGSSLWLVDPTKPPGNEEPPPYAPFKNAENDTHEDDAGPSSPITPTSGHVQLPSIGRSFSLNHPPSDVTVRHRASTMSSVPPSITLSLSSSSNGTSRRPQMTHSVSHAGNIPRGRSRTSTSTAPIPTLATLLVDENTPLLTPMSRHSREIEPETIPSKRRGFFRSVFCGEVLEGDERTSWNAGWRRFWSPVGDRDYWRAMFHLWLINFPFALFIWPPLLAGTLAGTALLITLPLGAIVWWLTLILARSGARLETMMQLHYHRPMSTAPHTYRPIFHRIKESSQPSSPRSPISEIQPEIQWEKRFLTCSWAMFSDHYSYSALSYFLLIKPVVTLFSTILLIALLPVAVVLVFGLPVYFRLARRWGLYQASVALENL